LQIKLELGFGLELGFELEPLLPISTSKKYIEGESISAYSIVHKLFSTCSP
jgi:hypothetical protein